MKKIFSGSVLKVIALTTMLIDHVGCVLVERAILVYRNDYFTYKQLWDIDIILRSIGRIAFPIYCFLLVEGFLHTKNIKKYILRLALFAFVSEIPFDLATSGKIINPYYQNIFFTLLIGLFVITLLEGIGRCETLSKVIKVCLCILLTGMGAFLAQFINADYGIRGVLPIVVLYFFRFDRLKQACAGALVFSWEFPAPLAFFPVLFYNGKRGKGNKYLFYIFYPLHLVFLYFIAVMLGFF